MAGHTKASKMLKQCKRVKGKKCKRKKLKKRRA